MTPARNTARYLDQTIASVVGQQGDFRIRYHIQDGGSRDRTLAIARDWQSRLASGAAAVRCCAVSMSIAAEPDAGMYDAIAAGFRHLAPAPGDFAAYINGDDVLATGALASVAQAFADMPDTELVGGRKALMDASGEPQVASGLPLYPRRSVAAGLHDGRRMPFVMQEGTFWRAGLWLRTGGVDTALRYAGDWDLWRRFAGETDYVALDTVTGYHRRRPGQISETLDAYYRELDARLGDGASEHEQLLGEHRRDPFPAAVARRDAHGRWVRADSRATMSGPRALWPIDGDWIAGPGFSGIEGPFPEEPLAQPFYRVIGSPAVAHIFSERDGTRTLSLWLTSDVADRQVAVRINGGPVRTRTLRRVFPKATCLEFRQHFDVGPAAVEISVDRRIATPQGLTPGLTFHSVGFWNGRKQISRLKHLLPKPLRAYV